MPNPKTQTVTMDVAAAVAELQKGRTEFRSDKTGVIHLAVGKVSMEAAHIAENIRLIVGEVEKRRPPEAKGAFVKTIAVSATMGPGVRVAMGE
jgi:large subunit ribosomal protein L1